VKTETGSSFGRHFGQKPILGIFLAFFNPVAKGITLTTTDYAAISVPILRRQEVGERRSPF